MWQERLSEVTKGMIVMNKKEKGQLNNFVKLCPKGTAEAVLTFVIDNWLTFSKKVQAEKEGVKFIPPKPTTGFLASHAGIAINMWSAAKNTSQIVKMPSCMTKPVQLNSPTVEKPVEEKKLTLAEFLADDEDD